MADRFSKDKRSQIMKCVKSKDTSPEKIVRSALHHAGFRFRLHRADLPGKPDIVLSRHRTVIFINGCFWHQHPGCRKATIPEDNSEFWQNKFSATMKRDERIQYKRRADGTEPKPIIKLKGTGESFLREIVVNNLIRNFTVDEREAVNPTALQKRILKNNKFLPCIEPSRERKNSRSL